MILGILCRIFLSLITSNWTVPSLFGIIVLLFAAVLIGYYWESKRDNYWLRGFIVTLIFGPIIGFIVGYAFDRVSLTGGHTSHYGYSKLMLAAEKAKPETILNLVSGGEKITKKTTSKRTALMIAAESNVFPQVCTILIEAGINVNDQDADGMTALMWACRCNNRQEVTETLIKAGADVNAQDKLGCTPLMHAAYKNANPNIVAILLKAGANPKILDNEGKSVFDYAYKIPNSFFLESDVYKYLRKMALITPPSP